MQTNLPITPVSLDRSLSTTDTLRDFLRWTHDEVLASIERGIVPVAFDLRAPGASRAEIRIWHPTVTALVQSGGRSSGERVAAPQLVLRLVPADVRTSTLERLWSVSHQHVSQLVRSGCLPLAAEPGTDAGPNSFGVVSAPGARQWLLERVIA